MLCHDDGRRLSVSGLVARFQQAQRHAGLAATGIHILRHTFCSHLAMRGVPTRAIQELAGHANSATTDVYMHLTPSALDQAIAALREEEE